VNGVPLQSLYVSDFRRLEGHCTFALDAPIVLIHGPNGTGKTSVLSALELALTGDIRSMSRQDERYTAHIPFHGHDFATLRVEVADEISSRGDAPPMTVGGDRIEGLPALGRDAARFYTERCYLDQVSLGRLLELYQSHERNQESALVRFVNELLGLEQLDALGSGLSDTADVRRLRNLSPAFAHAEAESARTANELAQASETLNAARLAAAGSRAALSDAIGPLGLTLSGTDDGGAALRGLASSLTAFASNEAAAAVDSSRALVALGGRIEALSRRPSVQRLEEARGSLGLASAALQRWKDEDEAAILEWRRAVTALGLDGAEGSANSLDVEIARIDESFERQNEAATRVGELEVRIAESRERYRVFEERLLETQETVGSLAEGLGALREHAVENVCPVCDRDFSEVSTIHLTSHIDQKIAEITSRGVELGESRRQRDAVAEEILRDDSLLAAATHQLWASADWEAAQARRHDLAELRARMEELLPIVEAGAELERETNVASDAVQDFESIAREAELARSELEAIAADLGATAPGVEESLGVALERVSAVAVAVAARHAERERAALALDEALAAEARVTELTSAVARVAIERSRWERRVEEVSRRRTIAKSVYDASSNARASIIQRVFTESLNAVWRSVFTRLAPQEPFVPVFANPMANRNLLELSIETIHTSGEPGGAPQMMLSAGNLNTAALSLFVALHLAVEPLVPCLVFDDPVQSMDEVHVSQFAALIRMLAKKHDRQVIIAVHERELFQYLCLELSPAFEGDELITIELGHRQDDEDGGVIRHVWSPDASIAV
jgi:exonuclease SbcC